MNSDNWFSRRRIACPDCGASVPSCGMTAHRRTHAGVEYRSLAMVRGRGRCACGAVIPHDATVCYRHEERDDRLKQLDEICEEAKC